MGNKEQLYKYKGNKCTVCGMDVKDMIERFGTFSRMFELHHIDPKKKSPDYNNLIRQKLSAEQLDEIDKCILLCKTCHGLVHAQDIKVNGLLTLEYGGRTAEQEFSGWLVSDKKENTFRVLCEETLLIEPYLEIINDKEVTLSFGTEISKEGYLIEQVKK